MATIPKMKNKSWKKFPTTLFFSFSVNPSHSKVDFESWFVDKNTSHFVAYLTINVLLILLYISLSVFVIQKLKANKVKAVGR